MNFLQREQRVGKQINIGTLTQIQSLVGRQKLDPRFQILPYRLDRKIQCDALLKHLKDRAVRGRPLAVVVLGTDDHLPDSIGMTISDFLARASNEANYLPFRPFSQPVCRQWPEENVAPSRLMEIITRTYLDTAPVNSKRFEDHLAGANSSIAFGFHLEAKQWSRSEKRVRQWVDELVERPCATRALIVGIIIISGNTLFKDALEGAHAYLKDKYEKHTNVVVLPQLAAISPADIRRWMDVIADELGDRLEYDAFPTLTAELFANQEVSQPLSRVWGPLTLFIRDACGTNG